MLEISCIGEQLLVYLHKVGYFGRQVDKWLDGWVDGWTDVCMYAWMDG
jgi:hypothetical protein